MPTFLNNATLSESNPCSAALQDRNLRICGTGFDQHLLLDSAWSTLVVDTPGQYTEVLYALDTLPAVVILPQDGGLLGTLRVSENFALALRYNQPDFDIHERRYAETMAERIFSACGMSVEEIHTLGNALPMGLERTKRWLAGFVRAILLAPELLVLDSVFYGLSSREALQIRTWLQLFPLYHPFRPVLLLERESEAVPDLPNCKKFRL